jgi:hypothetical protein
LLAIVSEQTSYYAEAKLHGAANTAKAYVSDLRHHSHWRQAFEVEFILATVNTLTGYVTN